MIIGVVGKSGAGKNYVADRIGEGYTHFDLDVYGHKVFEENIKEIGEVFYGLGYSETVKLSREDVGKIVFRNKTALYTLEHITHPLITEKVLDDIKGNSILNGAVLHKSRLLKKCDLVIYVKSSLLTRIKRLLKRDNRSFIQILKRIWSQKDINEKLYKNCLIVKN